MSADNCRIILLTGTPIINYPNELGILFNILRGHIKSWSLKLNIKTREKVNQDSMKNMLYKSKTLASILDFIEYKASTKTLVVAKNPMGFVNRKYKDEYKGVFKNDERGNISDKDFIKIYNLSAEVEKVAEILNISHLQIEAKKVRDHIVRDIVNIESLYIK